jgi:hypothetical protein
MRGRLPTYAWISPELKESTYLLMRSEVVEIQRFCRSGYLRRWPRSVVGATGGELLRSVREPPCGSSTLASR